MDTLICLTLILISAYSTFYLSRVSFIGPIRASVGTTLIFLFVESLLSFKFHYFSEVLFFGGSFIGMSGVSRIHPWLLSFSCFLFYLYFFQLAPFIKGMGGALGLGAFLSVIPLALLNLKLKKWT